MIEGHRRKGLGRGLAALMEDVRPDAPSFGSATTAPIDAIRPNPDQPRKSFREEDLAALAESIRSRGVVQPLIVRRDPERTDGWQIVAGERRWRAAQRAGLHQLPIVVRELADAEVLEIAILENVQRTDLNPIEEAAGYASLIERFGRTQAELAAAFGKSRSHIANILRLLQLPEEVQAMTRDGRLSSGHARALVTTSDPLALARRVEERGLSVRETERLAATDERRSRPMRSVRSEKDPDTRALEADLSAALGLKVVIDDRGAGGGELRIAYGDLEQLDRLCRLLSGQNSTLDI